MTRHRLASFIYLFFLTVLLCGIAVPAVFASRADDLRAEIEARNAQIAQLEAEIREYQQQVNQVSQEKVTLQNAIKTLDLTRKKLNADIQLTQQRINATTLEIDELSIQIGDKQEKIEVDTAAVAKAFRSIDEMETRTMMESLLMHDSLAEAWDTIETLEQFQQTVQDEVKTLRTLKENYESQRELSEKKKRELTGYKTELADQRYLLDANVKEKQNLLTLTANKEANYQKILNQKTAAREQFEQELQELESQLQVEIDPSRIPPAGKGVLAWPLQSIYITQRFGDTEFSRTGVYNGNGHNGVDFRAAVGTKVFASLGGVIEGTGDTDLVKGCYSYGKWVLIRHGNGLSTLYAHLSRISVNTGDAVTTEQIIGYSGNTGFSTGPHLHFTVYATQGVQIVRLGDVKKITNCGNARIPVAPLNAYLDPLIYL